MGKTDPVESLRAVCRAHGLAAHVEEDLVEQASNLRWIKENVLPDDANRTAAARSTALLKVSAAAGVLKSAIEALAFYDRLKLDDDAFAELLDDERVPAQLLDLAGSLIPRVEATAQSMGAAYRENAKAGRPVAAPRHRELLICIARVLLRANIIPARKGAFKELCAAVYLAGELTLPTRAFNAFLSDIKRVADDRAARARALAAQPAPVKAAHSADASGFAAAMATLNPDVGPVPTRPPRGTDAPAIDKARAR